MSTEYANLGFRVDSGGLLTADQRLKSVTSSGRATDAQVNTLNKTFNGLASTLGLATAALSLIGAGMSAKGVIDYSDAWSNVNSQLRQVTNSEQDLISTRSQLLKITKETRSELTNTVNLYAEMTRGTSELNISSERLMGVTKTLNNLFLAGGKPISEAYGAIRQLNQGFASGVLRGDEFNSVAEGAPKILDAMSQKLNMTRGELRAFAATGGITAEVMVSALEDYQVTAQKLADQTAKTFGQNLQNATTNVTEFVGKSESLNSAVGSLGGGIEALSKNLDALADAGKGVGAVLIAAATPAVYAYSVSLASAAKNQLLAGTTAVRTVNAFGQVTVAAGAATVATNGLAIASRFLLGPWGLLIAAVTAGASMFISAKSDSDDLAASLDEQAAKLARLNTVYSEMAKGDLESERNKLLERSNEILFERLELESKIEDARSRAFTRGGLDTEAYDELNRLKDAMEALNEESDALNEPLSVILKTLIDLHPALGKNTANTELAEKANKKAAQSYAEMVKNLENERQQLILTSDEFELYMVMQQASASQWTPAMTAQIISQTKAIQDQRVAIETTNAQLENMMSGDLFGLGGNDSSSELSDDLDSMIEKVDQFGGAWTNAGNVIAESMGSAVSVLEDFASKMQSITDLQSDLTKEREKYADGSKEAMKIDKSLAKLNAETGKAQIGAIGKTIGLSAQLFKENSKERKALHALEMGFMAVEIAMAAEKAIVNAVNAVASQGQGDPYTAFGRIAAMVGIMGGVLAAAGIAFGGGSGGGYEAPAAGGTGTVLGDSSAQSESISNVMEIYEEIQIDQLYELQKIRQSMSQLSSGIEQLASSFAQNLDFGDTGYSGQLGTIKSSKDSGLMGIGKLAAYGAWLAKVYDEIGDPLFDAIVGGFSKTKKNLVDSGISFLTQSMEQILSGGDLDANMYQVIETTKKKFWGLSKKTSTNTETNSLGGAINKQMTDIFGFIGETVIAATASLGLEAVHIIHTGLGALGLEEALKGFVIDIGDVSFLDKTGDEIQEELEAIFSQQADLMATYLVPSISDYQKVGEGAFETLQRVAYEQAVFNDALDRTGMSLSSLSKLMQIDVAQAVIDLTGGLDAFTELSNSFFGSFYTEAEQLSYLESSLSDVFSSLGLSLVKSREQFKDLVNGADLTTEAGRELYAMLLQIAPSMNDYLSSLEKEEEKRKELRISFLEDEKSLINSAINGLSSLVNSINSELGNAYSIQEALTAARMGDFELAKKMTRQRVKSSDFGDAVSFARAKAIEENRLFELGMLADAEKSDLERQVELLDKQIEAIENGTSEQVSAIVDLGVIMEGGNLEIIKAIMGPVNTKTNGGLMNDIPSGSSPINKSLEESNQQSANAMQQAEMMNREIVKNTKTTAKILQRMEFNQEQLQ